jgi:hypothetical protein
MIQGQDSWDKSYIRVFRSGQSSASCMSLRDSCQEFGPGRAILKRYIPSNRLFLCNSEYIMILMKFFMLNPCL